MREEERRGEERIGRERRGGEREEERRGGGKEGEKEEKKKKRSVKIREPLSEVRENQYFQKIKFNKNQCFMLIIMALILSLRATRPN